MTTAEHVKIVNDVSLSQRPTLPAARDKAHASSASRDLFLACLVCGVFCWSSNVEVMVPGGPRDAPPLSREWAFRLPPPKV